MKMTLCIDGPFSRISLGMELCRLIGKPELEYIPEPRRDSLPEHTGTRLIRIKLNVCNSQMSMECQLVQMTNICVY